MSLFWIILILSWIVPSCIFSTSMNPPGDCQVFAKEHDQEMYEPDY